MAFLQQCFFFLFLATWCLLLETRALKFEYPDFEKTSGLAFNGAAFTSSCEDSQQETEDKSHPANGYQTNHGVELEQVELFSKSERIDRFVEKTEATSREGESSFISQNTAGFGHRDTEYFGGFRDSRQTDCEVRLRLTPSQPFQRGSVWRTVDASLLKGFVTTFTFQITDLSKTCSKVRDSSFSTRVYESCVVHGGDGFAFVVHNDDNGTEALGMGGGQIGYGGIKNSLAIEFDTRYNPEQGDLLKDHVTIHSAGQDINVANIDTRLHEPRVHALADGLTHTAKVAYYPFIKYDFLDFFSASEHSAKFMMDNGEGYRMGTLVVWVDDLDTPVVVVPINLSILLGLESRLKVGFTSSTGKAWGKHDILSWRLTEGDPMDSE